MPAVKPSTITVETISTANACSDPAREQRA
jgi:hypothetical protein